MQFGKRVVLLSYKSSCPILEPLVRQSRWRVPPLHLFITGENFNRPFTNCASIVLKSNNGFNEGANSLLDFLDARNQLTTSALQLNIKQYYALLQLAEYERQTAVSKIK